MRLASADESEAELKLNHNRRRRELTIKNNNYNFMNFWKFDFRNYLCSQNSTIKSYRIKLNNSIS